MASFKISGPIKIPHEKRKGGRTLVFDRFWLENSPAYHLADECGCYVFAIQTGRGLTPIYVGRASKSFRRETFNPTNRHKYHDGFSEYARGIPVMFFVLHPNQKGRCNEKEIAKIEDFLIQAGVAKNPSLQNVRGAQRPKWCIQGVIRSGKGKRTKGETDFRRLLNLRPE
jgi:hypothetical protein